MEPTGNPIHHQAEIQPPIFYLIYISTSVELMTERELAFLLWQSRRNNIPEAITGMLLYMEGRFLDLLEGRFIQLLEGPESNVRALYERILNDERHKSILLLTSGLEESRVFPDWTMGYRAVDEAAVQPIAGFFQLNDDFLDRDQIKTSSSLLNYFRSFYTINQVGDRQYTYLK